MERHEINQNKIRRNQGAEIVKGGARRIGNLSSVPYAFERSLEIELN